MVGHRNHHGIDVGPREQVLIVFINIYLGLCAIFLLYPADKAVALDIIDITSGHNPDIVHINKAAQQIHSLLPQAYEAHLHLGILGCFLAFGRLCAVNAKRQCCSCCT